MTELTSEELIDRALDAADPERHRPPDFDARPDVAPGGGEIVVQNVCDAARELGEVEKQLAAARRSMSQLQAHRDRLRCYLTDETPRVLAIRADRHAAEAARAAAQS